MNNQIKNILGPHKQMDGILINLIKKCICYDPTIKEKKLAQLRAEFSESINIEEDNKNVQS